MTIVTIYHDKLESYDRHIFHLLANEIIKQDLPLLLPGVCSQGKPVKGAHVNLNFRPGVNIVRLNYIEAGATNPINKQIQQTNKPNEMNANLSTW